MRVAFDMHAHATCLVQIVRAPAKKRHDYYTYSLLGSSRDTKVSMLLVPIYIYIVGSYRYTSVDLSTGAAARIHTGTLLENHANW